MTFARKKHTVVGEATMSRAWTDEDCLAVIAKQAESFGASLAAPIDTTVRTLPPAAARLVASFLGHQPDQRVLDRMGEEAWTALATAASELAVRTGCDPAAEPGCEPAEISDGLVREGCPLRDCGCPGYGGTKRGSLSLP